MALKCVMILLLQQKGTQGGVKTEHSIPPEGR